MSENAGASTSELALGIDGLDDVPSELTLIEAIGRGAYGSVYKGSYGGKLTAVKAVPLDEGESGAARRSDLQTEIRMLRGCSSKWIVSYFGCLAKGRTLWVCMELCDGGSIADLLRLTRDSLTESELTSVCAAVV